MPGPAPCHGEKTTAGFRDGPSWVLWSFGNETSKTWQLEISYIYIIYTIYTYNYIYIYIIYMHKWRISWENHLCMLDLPLPCLTIGG